MSELNITQISAATLDALKRQSAFSLPDRPSERGMKSEDIKAAFWKPFINEKNSLSAEVSRVIDEANAIFERIWVGSSRQSDYEALKEIVDTLHKTGMQVDAAKYIAENYAERMHVTVEKKLAEGGEIDEEAYNTFTKNFSRLYTERSGGRGLYPKTALTLFGDLAQLPRNYDKGETYYILESVVQRLGSSGDELLAGNILVREDLPKTADALPSDKRYLLPKCATSKKYVDDNFVPKAPYCDDYVIFTQIGNTVKPWRLRLRNFEGVNVPYRSEGRMYCLTDENSDICTANVGFVKEKLAELVDSSPAALNTLNELARALNNDANYAATVTNALAGKVDRVEADARIPRVYVQKDSEHGGGIGSYYLDYYAKALNADTIPQRLADGSMQCEVVESRGDKTVANIGYVKQMAAPQRGIITAKNGAKIENSYLLKMGGMAFVRFDFSTESEGLDPKIIEKGGVVNVAILPETFKAEDSFSWRINATVIDPDTLDIVYGDFITGLMSSNSNYVNLRNDGGKAVIIARGSMSFFFELKGEQE